MNGNLNAALIFIDRALEQINHGLMVCERCGGLEETKDLDFVDDIEAAKSELIKVIKLELF